VIGRWREWARGLKSSATTLSLAARHPRTPWYAKAMALMVVGYAFSPIDLIPDFIPVLGLLDDLLLLPLGIWLTRRMIPPDVWEECRARAGHAERPRSWVATVVIVWVWICAGLALWPLVHGWMRRDD
jgi:uncharacterized membrane protein YkvA (DUF1232 family)